jgi:hypothetical protein
MKKTLALLCMSVLIGALGVACGGDGDKPEPPTEKTTPPVPPETPEPPKPPESEEPEEVPPEEEKGVKPVAVSEEVAAFFDENLYRIAHAIFDENGSLPYIDSCMMINSVDELPEIEHNGAPLKFPDIDFDSHTLVVGQYGSAHGGIYIKSQNIVVEQNIATIHLILGTRTGEMDFPQEAEIKPFWSIYSKINAESIQTIVNRKR